MVWPDNGGDVDIAAARAAALGVAWFRPPAAFVERWQVETDCPSCKSVGRVGLAVAITLRHGGRDWAPRRPSTPPTDPTQYAREVGFIVDAWRPALLVVENEENEPLSYSDGRVLDSWDSGGDTAQAYGRELRAACSVAHAHAIRCANGGLSSEAAAALTWVTLLDQGHPDIACDFAKHALYTEADPNAGAALCAYTTVAQIPPDKRARLLRNADKLLPIYRDAPIDLVNFHWYGHDATALAETASTLAALTGKPVMSNEIGQHPWDADPQSVRPLLRAAFAAGLKVAIWFSVDTGVATSLFDADGRLRPAGMEFAHQMSGRK
jgi:hypothetical protein